MFTWSKVDAVYGTLCMYSMHICSLMWPSSYTETCPKAPNDSWIQAPQKGQEAGGLECTTEICSPGGVRLASTSNWRIIWGASLCFLPLSWEISGAPRCWALSIVSWKGRWVGSLPEPPLMLWHSLKLCTSDALLPNQGGTVCVAKEYPAVCVKKQRLNLSVTTSIWKGFHTSVLWAMWDLEDSDVSSNTVSPSNILNNLSANLNLSCKVNC